MNKLELAVIFTVLIFRVKGASNYTFNSEFIFGIGTASYQVEGAWNESGKGINIWDTFTHDNPDLIVDGSNGDVACNSYHKYEEDVSLLQDLGVNFYRFSVSWARIFPTGHPNNLNKEGIAYYNAFIDTLVAKNITPMVTIYHWDLPQSLQYLGGWTNPHIVTWYTEYARALFENFSDRVKYWVTFNQPFHICHEGYGDVSKAPALDMSGRADYLCVHNLLKAHAAAYHLFNDTYKSVNDGKMGISLSAHWKEPNDTSQEEAAERARQFRVGLFANPIFSTNGDYPETVKNFVSERSTAESCSTSRLPTFTSYEIEYIKGTFDFIGLNHYTSFMVANSPVNTASKSSYENDVQVSTWFDPTWPMDGVNRLAVAPWGFRKLLNWIKDTYENPDIYITENGCADSEIFNDTIRISYHTQYLEALLEAINLDNVTVKGYAIWSLMDNFEWKYGYSYKYGLHYINFSDPQLKRTPKASVDFYKNVIINRTV